jgi:CBS domain containing-hemolysin-like protein
MRLGQKAHITDMDHSEVYALIDSSILYAIFKIVLALLLVVLNGIFVAAEFAFVKVRPTRLSQLAEEGNRQAVLAKACIDKLDAYLSVSQLGITLSSLGLGWLGEPAVAALLTPLLFKWGLISPTLAHTISFVVSFGLITFLHVVFGELAPKSLAIQRAELLSLWLALPMRVFYTLFYPAVVLLNGTATHTMRLMGIASSSDTEMTHSGEELQMIIAESYRGGQINENEQELLQNVFLFEESIAKEIMVPRTEMVFLDTRLQLEDNIAVARRTQHTRYPLCEGSPDRVIGLIHIKDLLYMDPSVDDIRDISREVMFVPETMPLNHLLTEFQKKHQHLAVVIDEYGGTSGIVTMDNVLEVLVGEIQDEFDAEEPEVIKQADGSYLVSGRMHIDDAAARFHFEVSDDETYNTLAGFILERLARFPQVGDCIPLENARLEVAEMADNSIKQVRVWPRKKTPSDTDQVKQIG